MAKIYLEELSAFIDRLALKHQPTTKIECKHFFSGAALYVNNRICLTLTPVGLAVKLPEKTKNSLFKNKEAVPLQYFSQSPIKKDYALFTEGTSSNKSLHSSIKESIEYIIALSLLDK